jgi:3-oxoadipate enol-lactonase
VPSVEVGRTKLHYERAGAGEPLLLIQGMSANRLAWGRPFSALLQQSFECISFDNRGLGLSSPVTEPFTIADMAKDTVGLLDALEIDSAHVLGISMGGMIAQELALLHPERIRSLVLGCTYSGGPGTELMAPAEMRLIAEALFSGDRQRYFRAMWELNLSPSFREEESRYTEFLRMAEARHISRQVVQFQIAAINQHDTSPLLPHLSTPTLVIHGTLDRVLPVVDAELLASLIPSSRLELLDGVGHMFWWEQPERSADLVCEHALTSAGQLGRA